MTPPMKSHDFFIPVETRPVYVPGSGPPLAPLSLLPEDNDTGWMILGIVQYKGTPQYQVCPKNNRVYRRACRKEDILDYVSQKVYEDFEYEEAKRKDDERWESENQLLARAHKLEQKRSENLRQVEREAADKAHVKRMRRLDLQEQHQGLQRLSMEEETSNIGIDFDREDLNELDILQTTSFQEQHKRRRRPPGAEDNNDDESEPKRQRIVSSQRMVYSQASLSEPSLSQRTMIPIIINSTDASDDPVSEGDDADDKHDNEKSTDDDSEEDDDRDELEAEGEPGDDDEVPLKTKTSLKRQSSSSSRIENASKVARVSSETAAIYNIHRIETPILPPTRPRPTQYPKTTPHQSSIIGTSKIPTPIPLPKRLISNNGTLPVAGVSNSSSASRKANATPLLAQKPMMNSHISPSHATKYPVFPDSRITTTSSSSRNPKTARNQSLAGIDEPLITPSRSRSSARRHREKPADGKEKNKLDGRKRRNGRSPSIGNNKHQGIEANETAWEIRGLLNDELRNDDNGNPIRYYLVDWEGDWDPSWEPETNVSKAALVAYRRKLDRLQLDGSVDFESRIDAVQEGFPRRMQQVEVRGYPAPENRPKAQIEDRSLNGNSIAAMPSWYLDGPGDDQPPPYSLVWNGLNDGVSIGSAMEAQVDSYKLLAQTPTVQYLQPEQEEQNPVSQPRGIFSPEGMFSVLSGLVRSKRQV